MTSLSDGLEKLEQIVRPIAWQTNGATSIWSEELIFRTFYTIYDEASGYRVFRGQFLSDVGEDEVAYAQTLDAAKAAAEADYRARIASALNFDPILSEVKRMREEVCAPELANEIWETLFNETKDCVPEALTNELLAKVAEALLAGYSIQRRAP